MFYITSYIKTKVQIFIRRLKKKLVKKLKNYCQERNSSVKQTFSDQMFYCNLFNLKTHLGYKEANQ